MNNNTREINQKPGGLQRGGGGVTRSSIPPRRPRQRRLTSGKVRASAALPSRRGSTGGSRGGSTPSTTRCAINSSEIVRPGRCVGHVTALAKASCGSAALICGATSMICNVRLSLARRGLRLLPASCDDPGPPMVLFLCSNYIIFSTEHAALSRMFSDAICVW